MPVTYNTAVKTSRMTATRDYFVSGTLEIQTSGDAVLATFTLTNPGGTVTSGVWTLAFSNSTVTASAGGTAAKAVIKNSGGNAHITGLTVGTSGADVNLSNTSITSGQSVNLTSATITHA
jgi:hypothetical protein